MLRFKAQSIALKDNVERIQEVASGLHIETQEQQRHIRSGPCLVNLATCGDLTLEELPAEAYSTQSARTRLFETRWASGINEDVRWSSDSDANMRDADEDSDDDIASQRYVIQVNGEPVLIDDYLGQEREELIHDTHDISCSTLKDPPHASRPRYPWQASGVAMMHKAREKFSGSLNIDEMGLGKTGQALDLIMTQKKHDNDAFSVVLTEKAVLMTWAREGAKAFEKGYQPRVHLLDDTRTTFAALWEGDYDVVLASYAAVMWQLRRLTKFWRFLHILRHCGRNAAEQAAKDEGLPTRRPTVPLFTSLLYLLPFRITTKILDEAHKLKKWDGKQRQAVESIPTAYVDLMTGTPCGNVWHDILSICALLPKEPFKTRAEYLKVFTSNSVSRVEAAKAPTAVDIINLARYLLPFTFGRTIDQLELKGVTHEPPTTFSISESQSELTLYLIESFIRIARMGKEEKDLNEDEIKSAMGFCTRAEQESGFPVLATYTAKQQDAMKKKAINLQDARKKFVQAVGEAKKIARSLDDADNQTARRLPGWADLDELQTGTTKFTEAMTRWLIECGFQQLLFLSLSAVTSAEDASNEATEEEIEDDTVEFTVPMDGEITNTTPIKNNKAKGENVKGNAKHTAFLEDVKNMADCDIFTPRCEAFLRLYEDILRTHPGEKILLWSRFYKGLVLVAEALRRRHGIQMPIYSGLLDTTARDTMIGRWESAALTDSKTPMAVQAKAGGTGLTLNAASQVVFLEPWWNSLDALQAERRAVRIGQEKRVHVWSLCCSNSFADAIINSGALRKLRIIDRIMAALRTPKDGNVTIPKHVCQYGRIMYDMYPESRKMDEEAFRKREQARDKATAEAAEGDDGPPASKRARLSPGAYAENEDMDEMEE